MIILKAVGLSLKLDGLTIFDNLNLTINRGEIISLVGPLGCGKTSLLKLLGCLIRPANGQVYLKNHLLNRPSSQIAYVWQKANLMPWRTVSQNISLPLEIKQIHPEDIKLAVNESLRLVGLMQWPNLYPNQLSGGMEQLTALARAMVTESQVLFLDEPFASMDVITREKMNQEVLRLWRVKKLTIILVSHNLGEAIFMSDRILIMGHKPRGIVKTLSNPLARNRNPALKQSAKYLNFYRQILDTMG